MYTHDNLYEAAAALNLNICKIELLLICHNGRCASADNN